MKTIVAVAVSLLAAAGIAVLFTGSQAGFPSSGQFEGFKWGSSEALVRTQLSKRGIQGDASVEISPGGRKGVRFTEVAPREALGHTADVGVLYVFIDNKLVAATVGFTAPVAEMGRVIDQLKATYELVEAVLPEGEDGNRVILDYKSQTGHVVVFFTLADDRKSVLVQTVFMAESEYQVSVEGPRRKRKAQQTPETKGDSIRLFYTP